MNITTRAKTQETGSKRIDNMLISTELLPMVKNMGYEPFHQGIQSNHRGMYVDLQQAIFAPAPYRTQRHLNARHGTQVQKYRAKLLKILKATYIIQRIKDIQKKHNMGQWTKHQHNLLQQIDHIINRAMLKAEKKSKPATTAPWSLKIKEAYKAVEATNYALKTLCPRRHKSTIRYPPQKLTEQEYNTYRTLWKQRKKTLGELQQVRRDAYEHCKTFLEEQADIEELKRNTTRAQILLNIRHVEELCRNFAFIRYTLKPHQSTNYTQISYPTTRGWEDTITPQEMKQKVLDQKVKHFHQASHTPVARQGDIFKFPNMIHPNELNTSTVPDTGKGLRKYFLRDPNTPKIHTTITQEEFMTGIKQ